MTDEEIEKAHELFFEMIRKSEDEINAMFNSGMFNSIAIGYGKIALEAMGLKKADLQRFEQEMKNAFFDYNSEDVRRHNF